MIRSKAINEFINTFTQQVFGTSLEDAKLEHRCVMCGALVGEFNDDLSLKEYDISGMCQNCQDDTFK